MNANEVIAYLSTQPLTTALFWFIENATDEAPWRTHVFFYLRDRVATESNP